jgi:hypothetical protein
MPQALACALLQQHTGVPLRGAQLADAPCILPSALKQPPPVCWLLSWVHALLCVFVRFCGWNRADSTLSLLSFPNACAAT